MGISPTIFRIRLMWVSKKWSGWGQLDEGEVTMGAVRHKAVEFYRGGE
jgi:hypothetical protein